MPSDASVDTLCRMQLDTSVDSEMEPDDLAARAAQLQLGDGCNSDEVCGIQS
jgi:hypothetical protein